MGAVALLLVCKNVEPIGHLSRSGDSKS